MLALLRMETVAETRRIVTRHSADAHGGVVRHDKPRGNHAAAQRGPVLGLRRTELGAVEVLQERQDGRLVPPEHADLEERVDLAQEQV